MSTPEEELGLDPDELEAGEGGGGGGEGDSRMIPEDVLPEDLRGMSPQEQKAYLQAMGTALVGRNQDVEELRDEVRRLREQGELREPDPEPVEDLSEEELQDLLREDPIKAVDVALGKLGYKNRFEEVGGTATRALGEAAFMKAAQSLPDFESHEDEVRKVIDQVGAQPSLTNIENAYNMVLGREYRQELAKKKKKARRSERPSPPEKPEKEEEKPSLGEPGSLKHEISTAMGVTEEDLEEYVSDGPMEMDVPTGMPEEA